MENYCLIYKEYWKKKWIPYINNEQFELAMVTTFSLISKTFYLSMNLRDILSSLWTRYRVISETDRAQENMLSRGYDIIWTRGGMQYLWIFLERKNIQNISN